MILSRGPHSSRKIPMESITQNIPELEEPFTIYLLTNATRIPIYSTTDVSRFAPSFLLQMDFFFKCWKHPCIYVDFCGYIICYLIPLCISTQKQMSNSWHAKFLVTTFSNQDKKVAFIRVDTYVALANYSESMKTCHNMKTIVQNTGGYASYLYGKSVSRNNKVANITTAILLNSSQKKEILFFAYQYAIWLSCRT